MMRIIITMPVYEDWDSAMEVCRRIDLVFREENSVLVSLLLVDDGSTQSAAPRELPFRPEAIEEFSIVELRRNLGHQRAIAVGLAYIQNYRKGDAVVIMDADGEDRPEDIPKLVAAMTGGAQRTAVFAERGKRLEKPTFRFLYRFYRGLHRILTGRDIRFGNFSVLPWSQLESLVVFPEMWNHYAATFVQSRLPYVRIRLDRSARLRGQSRMSFVNLVIHGLSALFAHQELVGTRLLVMILVVTLVLCLGIALVVTIKLVTALAIPGWATTVTGLLLILVTQALIAVIMLVFSIMMNRSQLGFLPIRDYSHFIRREITLYRR